MLPPTMRAPLPPECVATPSGWGLGLLAALALSAGPAHAQPGQASASLVQDTFSLAEPFDPTAPADVASVAAETQAALMLTSALALTETTASINGTPPLGELWQLCDGEAFAEQPTAAFCGGTLIASDLVLTAEHCVPDKRSCHALSVVFDYRYTSAGVLASIERDDVYACSKILVSNGTADYAIIQLDRAVVGRTPATPRFTDPNTCYGVSLSDRVWAAGFPSGVPLKLDLGDLDDGGVPEGVGVVDPNVTSRQFFRARFDLFAGMDGGGVFRIPSDEDMDAGVVTTQLVGFLSLGRADYARTSESCYAAVTVSGSTTELAGHVIQPLVALCRKTSDYPSLCPATVGRCFPGNAVTGEDAGMRAFPPPQGCGCRVPGGPASSPTPMGLLSLGLLGLFARLRRRAR